MSAAMFAVLSVQTLTHFAIADAMQFEVEQILVKPNGGVAAYASLAYSPEKSRLSFLCPARVAIPSSGTPWSLTQQCELQAEGIPEALKGERFYLCSLSVIHTEHLRPGSKLKGIIDLTTFFKPELREHLMSNQDEIRIQVKGQLRFYSPFHPEQLGSLINPGLNSRISHQVEAKPVVLELTDKN